MSYKAFIASTFEDLREHRTRVIDSLRSAGFVVDPAEDWRAAATAPRQFSADRLEGCNLCILLVGFRRGTIPEGKTRSITQIEYDEAIRRGVDVLPFLLEDSAPWPEAFDERKKDPEVDAWRRNLRSRHGIEMFASDPASIHVEPALARWVVEKESIRARRFRRSIYLVAAVMAAAVLLSMLYVGHVIRTPELRSGYLSSFLALHDATVFNHSSNGSYEIARVLDGYGSLVSETKLAEEILGTRKTFDMLVHNAGLIHFTQRGNFINLLKRGATIRIIIWDFSEANRPGYDAFSRAIGQDPEGNRRLALDLYRDLLLIRKDVETDRKTYRGHLDFRINNRPLLYTMWIRDWDVPANTLGHIGIYFYRNQQYWPSFRVSRRDGAKMLDNMHEEFEKAWSTSLEKLPGT
jgi:hypothetical protein